MNGQDEDARIAEYVHDHVAKTLGQLDSKAQILSGITTGALAFGLNQLDGFDSLSKIKSAKFWQLLYAMDVGTIMVFPALIAMVALLAAFVLALDALLPRSGPSNDSSIFFKGIISNGSGQDYASNASGQSAAQWTHEIRVDTYELARIAQTKFDSTRWGTRALAFGLAALAIHMIYVFASKQLG